MDFKSVGNYRMIPKKHLKKMGKYTPVVQPLQHTLIMFVIAGSQLELLMAQ